MQIVISELLKQPEDIRQTMPQIDDLSNNARLPTVCTFPRTMHNSLFRLSQYQDASVRLSAIAYGLPLQPASALPTCQSREGEGITRTPPQHQTLMHLLRPSASS